jgi:electron transport complex protein RnfC
MTKFQSKNISYSHRKLPGGIRPPEHKTISNSLEIQTLQAPDKVTLRIEPLLIEHLLVSKGQFVNKGEPLTDAQFVNKASMIHAPISGTVTDIGPRYFGHQSGLAETILTIKTNSDQPANDYKFEPIKNWLLAASEALFERIKQAGIVGLGGAAFPTHFKIASSKDKVDTLIINAMECEPYITCDDRLLQEHAQEIIEGAQITASVVGATKIIFGIEDNKLQAIKNLDKAIENYTAQRIHMEIIVVETAYPSGGEKQIIQLITGKEVPSRSYPSSIGLLVQNTATVHAIYNAVVKSKPLTSRVVTLTGDLIDQPGNFWVPIGTSVEHLIKTLNIDSTLLDSAIFGGPLMGETITDWKLVTQKSTNCIIFNKSQQQDRSAKECIRCAECEVVCPVSLVPQQLYWHSANQQWDALEQHNISDCIECGACTYVCPSEIPLVQYFRYAKSEISFNREKQQQSEKSKKRFDNREKRLERIKQERELKRQQKQEARRKAAENKPSDPDGKKSAIAAALARVKQKKANENE